MFPISSSQARVQYVVLMILLCPLMLCLATIPSVTIAYGQTVRQIPSFPVQHVQSELTQCADGPKHSSQARHCGANVLSHNSQVQLELRPVSSWELRTVSLDREVCRGFLEDVVHSYSDCYRLQDTV